MRLSCLTTALRRADVTTDPARWAILAFMVALALAAYCGRASGADKDEQRARKVKVALALSAADVSPAKSAAPKVDRAAKVAAALERAGVPSPAPFAPIPAVIPEPMPSVPVSAVPEAAPAAKYAAPACTCTDGCKCDDKCKCPGCCPAKAASTVTIFSGGKPGGTGTPIRCDRGAAGCETWLLTNRHVVHLGGPFAVKIGDKLVPARVGAVSQSADLAAIVVSAELPVFELAAAPPAAGSPVRMSTPGRRLKAGVTMSLTVTRDGPELATTIPNEPGDSGSAVLDSAGKVIGLSSKMDPPACPQLAVPLGVLRDFVSGRPVMTQAAPAPLWVPEYRPVWVPEYRRQFDPSCVGGRCR